MQKSYIDNQNMQYVLKEYNFVKKNTTCYYNLYLLRFETGKPVHINEKL